MSQQLVDILIPTHQNIFVVPDPVSTVLGIGLEGGTIEAPGNFSHRINAGKCRTGVVEFAGWEALRMWPSIVGKRIAWGVAFGTELGPKGAEKRIHLNGIHEITCYFSDGAPTDSYLSDAWCEFAVARPGTILVERVQPPSYRGEIIIPSGYRTAYRQSEAIIISAGDGVDKATFFPGRRVFLPAESNKRIEFDKKVYYQIFENAIVGIFRDGADTVTVEKSIPHPVDQMIGIEEPEAKFDEGDPGGPQ